MDTEKKDIIKSKQNRDFERHGVYTPKNFNYNNNNSNYNNHNRENKFRFKNSLVITPFYEIEFHESGGIKYIKNHDDYIFFTNGGIFATTNNIQKIPVLINRGINKQSIQKKLIVEEKYNYEEKYDIYKNIILYYEENRLDFQILFNKRDQSESIRHIKDITTDFSLNLAVPGISGTDDTVTYKKYSEKQEYKSFLPDISAGSPENLEYLVVGGKKRGSSCMTLYPDKKLLTQYKNKSLSFTASNISQPQRNYINLKIYLEDYRIT